MHESRRRIIEQAARLFAVHSDLKDTAQAAEWKAFLLRLKCPMESKRLFVERARRLLAFRR